MAAYAALVSVMNTLEAMKNHPHLSTSLDENQVEYLGEMLDFLLDFIETYNFHGGGKNAEDLERLIASAAHDIEDVIESHLVDLILVGFSLDHEPETSSEEVDNSSPPGSAAQSSSFMLDELNKIEDNIMSAEGLKTSSFLLGQLNYIKNMRKDALKAALIDKSIPVKEILAGFIEEMVSIKGKVIELKKEIGIKDQLTSSPTPEASSRALTTGRTTVVGFDSYLVQILDWLTGHQSDRQVITITGMVGIGKTTLARYVYENSLVVRHFDVCAWVTISHDYNVREILFKTLSGLGESTSELGERTEDELGGKLYKILFGRRYLIIQDDMWSIEAWNKIRFFFPENNNRSRIVVTTRQIDVANHFGSLELAVNFLNDDNSWSLFCEKAFAQEGCPSELQTIGRKIVKQCKGLPLSIVVIGGLLGKSSRAQEHWENVAGDMSSILNLGVENQCLGILSLSYSRLPACLKPCFLHLGIFPEDHEIRVSRLVKLWIAEGFLKPNKDQSLEEVAEGYIKDLVDRNLVLVRNFKVNGKTKTCYIHDLLRDLCLKIAEKEKFLCFTRSLAIPRDINRQRRIVIRGRTVQEEHHTPVIHTLESTSLTRSLISNSPAMLSLKSRLLRVLISVHTGSIGDAFQQVNLRFLAYQYENSPTACLYKLPVSISRLWNVQTLIITKGTPQVEAPDEIWEMRQLRHLKFNLIHLPYPQPRDNQDDIVLPNLQTLKTVLNFSCSEEVHKRIPSIKKLRLFYVGVLSVQLQNVGKLYNLESMKCSFDLPYRDNLLQNIIFPSSLKKLTLDNCKLHWNELTIIGSLPHLEVLKLYNVVEAGTEWCPVEGEFSRLKFLGVYRCYDLIWWNADSSHFPVLKKLVLERLWKLEDIPQGIGDIPTLEYIYVDNCSISTAISAMKMQKDQENQGNPGLHVEVDFLMMKDLKKFKKKLIKELDNP